MRTIFTILTFCVTGFLFFCGFDYWVKEKQLVVEFEVKSNQAQSVQVNFNSNGQFVEGRDAAQTIGTEWQAKSFAYSGTSLPNQVKITVNNALDSVGFRKLKVYNSVGNIFDVQEQYYLSEGIQTVTFPANGQVIFKCDSSQSSIVFNTAPAFSTSLIIREVSMLQLAIAIVAGLIAALLILKWGPKTWNQEILFMLVFISLISVGVTNRVFGYYPPPENEENRLMAPVPTSSYIFDYIRETNRYLGDHFSFRPILTYLDSYWKYKFLSSSSQPNKVVYGDDGHMFPVGLLSLADYQHKIHFSPAELEVIRLNLEERKAWLEAQGIPFILVIYPNKHIAKAASMPRSVVPGQTESRLQQMLAYLRKYSTVEIVDLTEYMCMLASANERDIFYKHDTHWNKLGGFYGYQALMTQVQRYMPDKSTYHLSDFDTVPAYYKDGDLAQSMLLHKILLKQEVEFTPKFKVRKSEYKFRKGRVDNLVIRNPHETGKLLMFRDSYTTNMTDFISNHFNETVFVWDHCFDADMILEYQPDLVVHELAELFIFRLPCSNPKIMKQVVEAQDSSVVNATVLNN